MADLLTQDDIDEGLADLPDWVQDGDALVREVEADSFLGGIEIVQAVAEAAEEHDHHPDIDIRYTTLVFTLSTHSDGGITDLDLTMAREIDRLVAAAG